MFKRIKQWNQHRQLKKNDEGNDLREFMYLDEVSVTSLLSSRLGAIPSEFKEAVTSSMTTDINGQVQADAVFVKSKVGSSIKSAQSTNQQVVRKATIQATFRDLYKKEQGKLVLSSPRDYENLPNNTQIQQALKSPTNRELSPWLIKGTELRRGQLAEILIELQADPIFRVSTVLSTVGSLFDKSNLLKTQSNGNILTDITDANSLLEQLMAGLIPIKCRLIEYVLVIIDGQEYIIHEKALEQIPEPTRPDAKPIFLTGILEEELFWKDIRRVLFSKARVKALCRLNYDSIQDSWTPVKLVNILEEVAPDLAEMMNNLGDVTMDAMLQGYTPATQSGSQPASKILDIYGQLLAKKCSITLTQDDIDVIHGIGLEHAQKLTSINEGRKGFDAVTKYFSQHYKIVSDPEMLVELRESARLQAAQEHAEPKNEGNILPSKGISNTDEKKFIDSEIIAIYW